MARSAVEIARYESAGMVDVLGVAASFDMNEICYPPVRLR
jgi:hypothetical protein